MAKDGIEEAKEAGKHGMPLGKKVAKGEHGRKGTKGYGGKHMGRKGSK